MRILVAENDLRLGAILREALTAGYGEVELVRDAVSALQRATESAFDVLLLDLNLPQLGGLEVLRRFRARNLSTPVLILSGRGDLAGRVRGLDLGADDCLVRPFSVQELCARLRVLLRRGPASKTILRVADLTLDRVARTVQRADRRIELTPREFALLEYLMLHVGTARTRQEILQHVWRQQALGYTNLVDVYINYLRRKIDQGFSDRLIQTQRGVGYSIGQTDRAPTPVGGGRPGTRLERFHPGISQISE